MDLDVDVLCELKEVTLDDDKEDEEFEQQDCKHRELVTFDKIITLAALVKALWVQIDELWGEYNINIISLNLNDASNKPRPFLLQAWEYKESKKNKAAHQTSIHCFSKK